MKAICIKEYNRSIHEASKYEKLYEMDFHVKRLKIYNVSKYKKSFMVKDEKCLDPIKPHLSPVSLQPYLFHEFFQIINEK